MRNIDRTLTIKIEREKIEYPLSVMDYHDYEPIYYDPTDPSNHLIRLKTKNDRKFVPYQNDDLVFINIRTSREHPEIRLARIIMVFQEFREFNNTLLPKWRVQLATKDSYWSQQWKYIYPGDIYRAYHDKKDVLRILPTIISNISEIRPIIY